VRLTNAVDAIDICVVHLCRPIGADGVEDRILVSDEIAKGTNGLKLDRVVLQQHRLGKGEERRSYTDHYPVGAILRLER